MLFYVVSYSNECFKLSDCDIGLGLISLCKRISKVNFLVRLETFSINNFY